MNQEKTLMPDRKPVVGITMGDCNGIGPEIILKVLADNHLLRVCTPVIYGSMKVLAKYRKLLKMKESFINQVNSASQLTSQKTNLVNLGQNKKI